MDTAEFDHRDFDQKNQNSQDENLLVKFYTKARPDKAAGLKEGRPVFKDVEYIDIRVPGSRDGVARPATFADKQRFPKHYAAFKQRVAMPIEGTPLSEWPVMTRSMVEELAHMNIKTIEQLANLNDNLAGQFMGINSFKQKAKDWLERAGKEVSESRFQEALHERDKKIDALEHQIAEFTKLLESIEKR